MIDYTCPHCKTDLELDESLIGKMAECPNCQKAISPKRVVPPSPPLLPPEKPQRVTVVDFDISFTQILNLMVKFFFAALVISVITAVLIFGVVTGISSAMAK